TRSKRDWSSDVCSSDLRVIKANDAELIWNLNPLVPTNLKHFHSYEIICHNESGWWFIKCHEIKYNFLHINFTFWINHVVIDKWESMLHQCVLIAFIPCNRHFIIQIATNITNPLMPKFNQLVCRILSRFHIIVVHVNNFIFKLVWTSY